MKKEKKIIDCDLTIKDFFKSVIDFLNKRKMSVKAKEERQEIVNCIEKVKKLAENPKKLVDMDFFYKEINSFSVKNFAYAEENSFSGDLIYTVFIEVLHNINNFYGINTNTNKKIYLLRAIKHWYTVISPSFLKSFICSFKPAKSFASRTVSKLNEKSR